MRTHSGALASVLLLSALAAHAQDRSASPKPPAEASAFVHVAAGQLLDAAGRPLVLNGVNVGNSLKLAPDHIGDLRAADFEAIRALGMNCIRLTIFWDGLEPQPGRIDQAYLDRIARVVRWAKAKGVYVLLDMHQDLYSGKFKPGDGAPAWAVLDDGKPHTPTAIWSDAYARSEAVQAALDHFWNNAPAPDGTGLQDHYARVWRAVAQRFASEPAIAGYDLMNEPAPGKDYGRALQAGIAAAGLAGGAKDRELLRDPAVYRKLIDALTPILQDFERTRLMPFYSRVARAIREVDARHILVIEPNIMGVVGVPTVIQPLAGPHGERDPQQIYGPHAYDLNTDTGSVALANDSRIKAILDLHAEEARRLQMPLFIGEWGAYGPDPQAAAPARFIAGELNRLGCSATYWDYSRDLPRSPIAAALRQRRPGSAPPAR